MTKKIIVILLIFSLAVPHFAPQKACAGGSGGEPLISDAVGWGIVGALVITGIYLVYKTKQGDPPAKDEPEEKNQGKASKKTDASGIISDRGDIVIAKW